MTATPGPQATVPGVMRFAVDGWDPSYGTSLAELDLEDSDTEIDPDVETPAGHWGATPVRPADRVPVVFVDGVRRIEARVWIDDQTDNPPARDASVAICASYAAGAVCCCERGAHLVLATVHRGLFALAGHAADITTSAGVYRASRVQHRSNQSPAAALSAGLQVQLTDLEVQATADAAGLLGAHGIDPGTALTVVDGPLRDRGGARILGFVKSHRRAHLPADLHQLVGGLGPGERTPVFALGQGQFRQRFSWYLRLPCLPGAPWAGVVRIEAAASLDPVDVIGLADLSQAVLPRFGSAEYKDSRAPQNLYPVAGLERELRRRLGDPAVLYRALRVAADGRPTGAARSVPTLSEMAQWQP